VDLDYFHRMMTGIVVRSRFCAEIRKGWPDPIYKKLVLTNFGIYIIYYLSKWLLYWPNGCPVFSIFFCNILVRLSVRESFVRVFWNRLSTGWFDSQVVFNKRGDWLDRFQIVVVRAILGIVFAVVLSRFFYPDTKVLYIIALGIFLVGMAYFFEYLRENKKNHWLESIIAILFSG